MSEEMSLVVKKEMSAWKVPIDVMLMPCVITLEEAISVPVNMASLVMASNAHVVIPFFKLNLFKNT